MKALGSRDLSTYNWLRWCVMYILLQLRKKKVDSTKCSHGSGATRISHIPERNAKRYNHLKNHMVVSQNVKHTLPYNPAVPILGSIYPREMNTYALRKKDYSQLRVRDGGKGNMRDACGDRTVAV